MPGEADVEVKLDTSKAVSSLTELIGQLQKLEKAAGDAASPLNRTFQQKDAVAGFAQGVGNLGNAIRGMAGVAQQAWGAFDRLAGAVAEVDQRGRAIAALGSSYQAVAAATRGAVTAQQALLAQQTLAQSGLRLTSDQLATLSRNAREFAISSGRDVNQTLQEMTNALRSGSREELAKFGITAKQGADRVTNMNLALEQLKARLGQGSPAARTATEEYEAMHRSLQSVQDEILKTASAALGVPSAVGYMSEAFQGMALAVSDARNEIVALLGVLPTATHAAGTGIGAGAGRLAGSVGPNSEGISSGSGNTIGPTGSTAATGPNKRIANPNSGGGGGGGTSVAQMRRDLEEAYKAARDAGVQFRELTLREGETFEAYGRRVTSTMQLAGHAYEDFARNRGESVRHALARITAAIREATDQQKELDALMQRRITPGMIRRSTGDLSGKDALGDAALADDLLAAQARGDKILAPDESDPFAEQGPRGNPGKGALLKQMAEQQSVMAQMGKATTAFFASQKTGAEGAAEVWGNMMSSMTNSFKQHLAAVVTGRETIGQALQGILQETLLNLTTESAVKSIFELAQGVAAAATYQYAEATQHFVASGIYAAVAGAAGAATYGLSTMQASASQGAPQVSAQTQTARAGNGAQDTQGGGNTYVINVNGALLNEGVEDGVVRAIDRAHQRGVMPRSVRRMTAGA